MELRVTDVFVVLAHSDSISVNHGHKFEKNYSPPPV